MNRCPLPRIGSKRWGWVARALKHPTFGFVYIEHSSTKCTTYQIRAVSNSCAVYNISNPDDAKIQGTGLSLQDAKTLAESKARRDWRRENRGKK